MTESAGWVVVLALSVIGLQVPLIPMPPVGITQAPATVAPAASVPQSLSTVQLLLQAPAVQAAACKPLPTAAAGHWPAAAQAFFWKTPVGPTGEAQVLVTKAWSPAT